MGGGVGRGDKVEYTGAGELVSVGGLQTARLKEQHALCEEHISILSHLLDSEPGKSSHSSSLSLLITMTSLGVVMREEEWPEEGILREPELLLLLLDKDLLLVTLERLHVELSSDKTTSAS